MVAVDILALLGLQVLAATAATVSVSIGPGNTFNPDTVTAAIGDTVEFKFSKGHSVVQGDFNNGCQPAGNNPFFSGVINNSDIFRVNITTTDPIFFYCSVGSHCKGGMSGVINPSGEQTLAAYRDKTKGAGSAGAPGQVSGGEIVASAGVRSVGVAVGSLVAAVAVGASVVF